ncbi:F-box domain-containing protein [Heracleum sosnowskyi]|uniref:F-box domain-containing protein n=1 Tax=Heracleum sosnowskyi TaxID=360622 RepID=A0AAD8MM45_9APIA|nr:F-box domain-containing protein [Heracleum sosnowskyi]
MARRTKKKAKFEDKDRISKLPDELIHHILGYVGMGLAVQTSVLSKRWKLLWTTLPFLNFDGYDKHYSSKKLKFYRVLKRVFFHRNHEYRMFKLVLHHRPGLTMHKLEKYVKYAILHNVECLDLRTNHYCPLLMFSSNFLRELKLTMDFESDNVMESNRWTLPNLTTLFLKPTGKIRRMFLVSCLTCLPALTTLGLNQCVLPDFFSLPGLRTLCLESCDLAQNVWDLPALLSLQLTNVSFKEDMIESLVSLRNLTIDFDDLNIGCCNIFSSQLVNLNIRAPLRSVKKSDNIVVQAPRLCNFNAIGFFRTTIRGSELKKVNVKFWDKTMYRNNRAPSWVLKRHKDLFQMMFSQLGSAEMLSVDLVTLQALSGVPEILENLSSPFYNLKNLKLPPKCEESIISSPVRHYLLGGSLSATVV